MMSGSLQDLVNQKMAQAGVAINNNLITSYLPPPTKPTQEAVDFRLIKVSNGHILEMKAGPYRITRIIPQGEDIGAHVTTALVEAKLEK